MLVDRERPTQAALRAAVLEAHRPTCRPYPGAPGFHLASCRVCDGRVARVRADGGEPYACQVWRDAVTAGLVAEGSRGTSSTR